MNVYQTDYEGFYLRTIVADPNPRPDPNIPVDQWLVPAGCVRTPPPRITTGKRARWNGVIWELIDAVQGPVPDDLTPEEQQALWRETATLSPFQLVLALKEAEIITPAEGLAWLKLQALPAALQAYVDSLPEDDRFEAEGRALRFSVAERLSPMLIALGEQHFGEAADAAMDAMFAGYASR